jgi:hypothetical protein
VGRNTGNLPIRESNMGNRELVDVTFSQIAISVIRDTLKQFLPEGENIEDYEFRLDILKRVNPEDLPKRTVREKE